MSRTGDIDRVLREAVEERRVAGVVALAADAGGVVYEGAFGERMLGGGVPMSADTVFHIASMTKAITAAAAMQLVEQGRLALDEPLGRFAPYLAAPPVLEGFDAAGQPRLRPARGTITLRQLMTHTAGFSYEVWNADLNRYQTVSGKPGPRSGRLAGLEQPLVSDPGARWEYGINIDWIGRVVEAIAGEDLNAYLARHIFAPLGMADTTFTPTEAQAARGAGMHTRRADGTLADPEPFQAPRFPEFFPGGGGLVSTGPDYLRFLRALLAGGGGVLRPETVALMAQNHMGALDVLPMQSVAPALSHDCELFPGMRKKWGLSFLINTEAVPGRRSAGSLCWAGLRNTYYWLDPTTRVAGVLLTQSLPFADPVVLRLLDAFETEVYKAVG
jgi:CubicO group peptidase (beta-lactamase class C family)